MKLIAHVVIVSGLLGACYKPSTESCYYACATQGQPCPSGLECVAGMCATPGESCSTDGDGPHADSDPGIDAPPPACGNGVPAVGEICYRPPITLSEGNQTPLDGQLADWDGDGDLDVVFILSGTAGSLRAHLNPSTASNPPYQPASTATIGPSISNPLTLRSTQLDTNPPSELIAITDANILTFRYTAANGAPAQLNTLPYSSTPIGVVIGQITSSGVQDLAVLSSSTLTVFRWNMQFVLSQVGSVPVAPFGGVSDIAIGALDPGMLDDIALSSGSGIGTMNGAPNGLVNQNNTSVTSPVSGVGIGDIDRDSSRDIFYVVAEGIPGQTARVGVIRGMGDGTFVPAVTMELPDLESQLEVADLDGDGRDDVIAIRGGSSRALAIFRGRQDGNFEMPVFITLPGAASQLSVRGDFNNDMRPDIVVTDRTTRSIYVFASNP